MHSGVETPVNNKVSLPVKLLIDLSVWALLRLAVSRSNFLWHYARFGGRVDLVQTQ